MRNTIKLVLKRPSGHLAAELMFKGVVPGWWAKAGYRVNKCGLDHCVVFLRKRMRSRLYSPNGSLHPVVKMSASKLSCKHYEMEGDNLWWTGILSRGV